MWEPLENGTGIVEVYPDGAEIVVIDPRLGRRERRVVLAHELVHLERRLLPRDTPRAVVRREEFQVQREAVRRLVPPAELQHFIERRGSTEPITGAVVADEFDVPEHIAVDALADLRNAVGVDSVNRLAEISE